MELAGKTVLITRAASQSQPLQLALEKAGARVMECPAIETVPVEDWSEVDRTIRNLNSYNLLIFTSGNAVDFFLRRASGAGVSCQIPIAVIGTATADKLARWNLTPSLIPQSFRAE